MSEKMDYKAKAREIAQSVEVGILVGTDLRPLINAIAAALREREAEVEGLRQALEAIISIDQIERRKLVKADPAGSDYEVEEIDGRCARIARTALGKSPAGTGE